MSADAAALPQDAGTLYCDHHGWLKTWLRRRLGSVFDAEDLAQDTFMRLLRAPRHFDSFEGARAYLSTIAKGLCTDLWRRREIEAAWLDALAAQPEAFTPSAEHRAIIIEALCAVDAMLRQLPPRAANAFVMAQVHGMGYREIGEQLGVSERMVKKYMAQAMLHCALIEAGLPTS
ncbi:MAG: sigma-70 family RNA polymerase sigma factor [Rhodocyclaceae bacterium]